MRRHLAAAALAAAVALAPTPAPAAPWCEYTDAAVGDAELAHDLRQRQLAWYLVSLADIASTDWIIRDGGREVNPIVVGTIGERPSTGELWAFGLATTWAVDMLVCKRGGSWRERKRTFEILAATRGILVIWNIGQF